MEIYGRIADMNRAESRALGCRQVLPVEEVPVESARERLETESEGFAQIVPMGMNSFFAVPIGVNALILARKRWLVERAARQVERYNRGHETDYEL